MTFLAETRAFLVPLVVAVWVGAIGRERGEAFDDDAEVLIGAAVRACEAEEFTDGTHDTTSSVMVIVASGNSSMLSAFVCSTCQWPMPVRTNSKKSNSSA